jgi:glycosyltransferase involved in cell wall biosynthesis
MTDLVRSQHAAFHSFVHAMDRLVVLCDWTGELLVRNGIPVERVMLSRHGLPQMSPRREAPPPVVHSESGPLRIAFLGRLHPTKGLDILLRAIASLPEAALELHVFGVVEGPEEGAYVRSVRASAAGDPRIRVCAPVPSDQVPALLRGYDVVAVPSRWMETGPLVVLEAFAAGVPVVGSRLGGIVELVDDGVDGLLVEPESVAAWAVALRRLVEDRGVLQRLRAGVRPPRRMDAVADDMQTIYGELVRPL